MLNNISWQGYWLTIALISTGYYLSIYLLYYRNDFKILVDRKSTSESFPVPSVFPPLKTKPGQSESFDNSAEFEVPDKNSEEAIVYACIDELDAFFNQSRKGKCLKEEIIFSLQSIIKKYPSLKQSAYKASLTNVMVGQCEHICSIHLNADDVVRVWVGE